MEYKLCALLPTYNHHKELPVIVHRLRSAGLPVFIVDDGSDQKTNTILETLDAQIFSLPVNSGKGAALKKGFLWVAEQGYTHAFQIDADGQHALDDLEHFIDISKKDPQALVSGNPVYDSSIPFARKIGRWLTHVWVFIETLSFKIKDSMCGFRIYPLKSTLSIIQEFPIGDRMDFDTEILVRLFWKGTTLIMLPVKVTYPEGNHSNFDVLKDNWSITKMHTRLVFSLLSKPFRRKVKNEMV